MILPHASGALGIMRDKYIQDNSMNLLDCYTNGRFDFTKFILIRNKELDNDFEKTAERLMLGREQWGNNNLLLLGDTKRR